MSMPRLASPVVWLLGLAARLRPRPTTWACAGGAAERPGGHYELDVTLPPLAEFLALRPALPARCTPGGKPGDLQAARRGGNAVPFRVRRQAVGARRHATIALDARGLCYGHVAGRLHVGTVLRQRAGKGGSRDRSAVGRAPRAAAGRGRGGQALLPARRRAHPHRMGSPGVRALPVSGRPGLAAGQAGDRFHAGHSLSLALAAFDVVRLPSPPVEACIAMSIAFMAREALLPPDERRHGAGLVLAFGLLHGLGFAGAL